MPDPSLPSAPALSSATYLPSATYRLQFHRDFDLAAAIRILPYLQRLGISHIYSSPLLKARADSPHGYDIVDHNALNPQLGSEEDFLRFIDNLHRQGMGLVLDIVPNHMGVGGDDNSWWLDVLEQGEASPYAGYFDIDWYPANPVLQGKLLLPFLGDHYGTVLENGELKLHFDPDAGSFHVRYYSHLFPIDPRTYGMILQALLTSALEPASLEPLRTIVADLRALPRRSEVTGPRRLQRQRGSVDCKNRLAALLHERPELLALLRQHLARFNGSAGVAESFEPLHQLLERQAYRLAFWRVAADEINYRRFFDVNELAGIRMEQPEVFAATHALLGRMISAGQVNGLRLDHPDGLSNPLGYYRNLQKLVHEALGSSPRPETSFCLWVEKILANHEHLPADWPVAGTTGYEAAFLLNGLFVYGPAQRALSRRYASFSGDNVDFGEQLYRSKKLIIRATLSSEMTVLANLLSSIAQADRHTRDFTRHGIREALTELVACFPVYRTYISLDRISDEDRRYVQWALAQGKKRSTGTGQQIFDFIEDVLIPNARERSLSSYLRRRRLQFRLRLQQYTAPVMAKSMEDTAFYRYHLLAALNDVGFDPRVFAISISAFHQENKKRLEQWPHAMVTTSSHDSKRGEDVRLRIAMIAEFADEWQLHLRRWRRLNRKHKSDLNGGSAPSSNDEYLLYQTLLGLWPLQNPDAEALANLRERLQAYMLKALREAKQHTSWHHPDADYEAAMQRFVNALLEEPSRNPFLVDFLPWQQRLNRFALFSSLSQSLLRCTMPGMPDLYQGNELWAFNLVDPDNRRPVDYELREHQLAQLSEQAADTSQRPALLAELLECLEDGRAKLYVIWQLLQLRRAEPELFAQGAYLALETSGPLAEHICAFSRRLGEREIIVVASRWFGRLARAEPGLPIGSPLWDDSWIQAPRPGIARNYRELFSGRLLSLESNEQVEGFATAEVLRQFPVAVLVSG